MSERDYPTPTPIYHFTHIRNLPEILRSGCVFCQMQLPQGIRAVDISYYDLQERRRRKQVECGPGGCLHDYVPFYFAPRSSMMYAISRGNVEGYAEDTGPLIYLVSSVPRVQDAELEYVFTDGHPTKAFTRFFDDARHLNKVQWDVMRSRYWNDTAEYPDRKRRRQAEFLVYGSFPWSEVEYLVVKSSVVRERVQALLADSSPDFVKQISIEPDWYF